MSDDKDGDDINADIAEKRKKARSSIRGGGGGRARRHYKGKRMVVVEEEEELMETNDEYQQQPEEKVEEEEQEEHEEDDERMRERSRRKSVTVTDMLKKGPALPSEKVIMSMEKQARARVSVCSDLLCPGAIVLTRNGAEEVSAKVFAVRPTLGDIDDVSSSNINSGKVSTKPSEEEPCHATLENAARGAALMANHEVFFYSVWKLYKDPKYGPERAWKLMASCFFITRKARTDSLQHLGVFLLIYQARDQVKPENQKYYVWNATKDICAMTMDQVSRQFVRGATEVLSTPPPQSYDEHSHPVLRNRSTRKLYVSTFEKNMSATHESEFVTYPQARYCIPISVGQSASCIDAFVACADNSASSTLFSSESITAPRLGLSMDLESAAASEARAKDTTWSEREAAARGLSLEHMSRVQRLRADVDDARAVARSSADRTFPMRYVERTTRSHHEFSEGNLARVSSYQQSLAMLGEALMFSTLVNSELHKSSGSGGTDSQAPTAGGGGEGGTAGGGGAGDDDGADESSQYQHLAPSHQIEHANYALLTACILAADVTGIACRPVSSPLPPSGKTGGAFRSVPHGKKGIVVATEYELYRQLTMRERLSVPGVGGPGESVEGRAAMAGFEIEGEYSVHTPFIKAKHVGDTMRLLFLKALRLDHIRRVLTDREEPLGMECVFRNVTTVLDSSISCFIKTVSDPNRVKDLPLLCALSAIANVGVTNPIAVSAVLLTCEAYFSGLLQDRADMAAALFWCASFVADPIRANTCNISNVAFNIVTSNVREAVLILKSCGKFSDLKLPKIEKDAVLMQFDFQHFIVSDADIQRFRVPWWATKPVFSNAFREIMDKEMAKHAWVGIEHNQTTTLILESILSNNAQSMCVDALMVINPTEHYEVPEDKVKIDVSDPVCAFGIRASIGSCIMACMQSHADYSVVLACSTLRCMIRMWQRGACKGTGTAEIATEFDFGRKFVCAKAYAHAFKGVFPPDPYCRPAMVLPRMRIARFGSSASRLAVAGTTTKTNTELHHHFVGGGSSRKVLEQAASAPTTPTNTRFAQRPSKPEVLTTRLLNRAATAAARTHPAASAASEQKAEVEKRKKTQADKPSSQTAASASRKRMRPLEDQTHDALEEQEKARNLILPGQTQTSRQILVEMGARYKGIMSDTMRLSFVVCNGISTHYKYKARGKRFVGTLLYKPGPGIVVPAQMNEALSSCFVLVKQGEPECEDGIHFLLQKRMGKHVKETAIAATMILACAMPDHEFIRVVESAAREASFEPLGIETEQFIFVPPSSSCGYQGSAQEMIARFKRAWEKLCSPLRWGVPNDQVAKLLAFSLQEMPSI